MRESCEYCGTKLIDRNRFHNNYTYTHFLNTGKCQKCQDYDIYLGRVSPDKKKNKKQVEK